MDWLKSIRAAAPPSSSSSSPTYELLGSSSSSPDLPAPSTHPRPAYTHARRRSSTSSFNYHRARLRPHQHQHQHHGPYFHVIPPIAFVPVVVFALGFIVYHFVFRIYVVDEFVYGYPDVPDYDEYWAWEDKLPQHNTSLEFPEGANGRYVMFSNQAWGYGLNNQLQEM
ncbi:hypothetical protein FRB90_002849 [Tulasnella sp. 427]|nr:hypothetical protein FRB90_002849 [Tulasnella sp. 427]